MINALLTKLYGIILERKINVWLESEVKRAKGHVGFRNHHSTIYHLIMLTIIAKHCHNIKSNHFCCFVDFRKSFDTLPRDNLCNRLGEL